ncbi:MAG: uracil phosphoribosyltransferase [Bacteroidota bacterium]
MIVNLSEQNTIANQFVSELRDVHIQKDRMRFRRNLGRLGEVMAYEISKTFDYVEQETETPLGIAKTFLPQNPIVIGTILRAGLPFHQGFLNYFDQADNAFISAYRMHHKSGDFEIKIEYVSSPDLDGCVLILVDPMLATGASLKLSVDALANHGQPSAIHIATAIASANGLSYIKRVLPKVHVWMGALDEELTAKSYIVPGLGDAGDLSFGGKL